MSTFDTDPVMELDELLDSARLAAAWQAARERERGAEDPEVAASGVVEAAGPGDTDRLGSADATGAADATDAAEPARPAPLRVAVAHRLLLEELDRTLAASPELAAKAGLVLAAPLAQLAAAIDPLDGAAAGTVLDDLEDLLQALLSAAGWPASGEE